MSNWPGHLYVVPHPASAAGAERFERARAERAEVEAPEHDRMTLAVLAMGLVPLVGFALLGRWRVGELGLATAITLWALLQLVSGRRRGQRPLR